MGWPRGSRHGHSIDCGRTPHRRPAEVPKPIREALQELRTAIRNYAGRYGRDPLRATPFGYFLDAIDAGRDGLHPDDAHSITIRFLTECCDPAYRQRLINDIAEWEAEQGIVHAGGS